MRKILLKVAYKNAKDGNYSYHRDIHDRIYGQAIAKSEVKNDINVVGELADQLNEWINSKK